MIQQVADTVIVQDGKVLLVQQRKAVAYGLWSYPGGRVEPDETPAQAVVREVQEELGVTLTSPELFKIYSVANTQGEVEINTFTGQITGVITLNDDELLAYGWFSVEELKTMPSLRSDAVLQQAMDVVATVS